MIRLMRVRIIIFIWSFLLYCFVGTGLARTGDFTWFGLEGFPLASAENTVTLVTTSTKTYTADNLFQSINGAADQFIAYGFSSLSVTEYEDLPQKSIHATVELYRMADHLAAFGIYSAGRFEGVQFTGHGAEGFISGPVLVFFKGEFYVKISCFTSDRERQRLALEQLGEIIARKLQGTGGYPTEIGFLTKVGIDPKTISFGPKGLLGYDFLPPGFQTKYPVGEDSVGLFAAVSADAHRSQEFLRSYLGAMRIESRSIQEMVFESVKMWEVDDPYQGRVVILANQNILIGVKGLAEYPEAVLKILIKIAYNK